MAAIEKSSLDFLRKLAKNNNREWFLENKNMYESAKDNMIALVDQVLAKMKSFEPAAEGLEGRKCMYRIYRDVRFSKDKSPYKINLAAAITPGGRTSMNAGYYIHIEPGNKSFVGGGIYMPPPEHLKAVRQEIAYNTDAFEKIIQNKKFVKLFGELWGEKMKNVPREYPKDHKASELLKFKSYIVGADIEDEKVLSPAFEKTVVEMFKELHPFMQFLNHALEDVKV